MGKRLSTSSLSPPEIEKLLSCIDDCSCLEARLRFLHQYRRHIVGNPVEEAAERVPPTRVITDADVAQLADWKSAFDASPNAYRPQVSAAMVPPRSVVRGDGTWLRGSTAVSPNGR